MFENTFKKNAPPAPAAQQAPGIPEADLQAWRERILAAEGDDAALLQLAKEAPGVDLKLAVVSALTREEVLKQAVREFRDQDKRLYRAAKSRWQEAVARREALAEAPLLIAAARNLVGQESVPANRLVELDRAWEALNAGLLDDALVSEFAEARAQLVAKVRQYGEGEQAVARWLAAADAAIHALTQGLAAVAQGTTADTSAPADSPAAKAAALLQLLEEVPGATGTASDARCIEKTDAARRALALASSVVQRAEFLKSLPPAGVADEAEEKARIDQWRGFPEVADEGLQALLAHRFSAWRNSGSEKRQRDEEARRAHERETSAEERKRRLAAIQRHVESAEAAQAGGHVDELTRLMALLDKALERGPVNAALTKRIDALRQEQIRLRDWQRWAGAQRREELVTEAQALAKAAGEKISVKAHADAIDKLRERWKELDKLGGATSKALWTAFDGALKSAYAPVAAHLEKLKAARNENLAARNRVIEGLVKAAAATPVDLRSRARALEEARIAWRKLGPIEHTVPRQAQKGDDAVTARYAAAVQALEAPLSQAYGDATRERERLIAAAKSLGEARPLARDAIDKVRALQAQWQAHAKSLALPRRDENALWTAFKAATDSVFTARDAARAARDAEAGERNKARAERDAARTAREAEAARQRASAAQAAQARFDALIEAMRLCDEREAAGEASPELEARWSAVANLPKAWKPAMEARFRGTSPKGDLPAALLNLEVACGIDSPAEFAEARRKLKLLALKNAMESRRGAAAAPPDLERDLLAAAAMPNPDDASRARLAKIVAAVRTRRS